MPRPVGWKRRVAGLLLFLLILPFLAVMTVILSVPIVTIPIAIAVIVAVAYFVLGAGGPGQTNSVRDGTGGDDSAEV